MKIWFKILFGATALCVSNLSFASDIEHFKGLKPSTYQQAQVYLNEYNAKLATIVEDGIITPNEMAEVHQLTYTLENSLKRMKDSLEQIEEVLELVHKDSEHGRYEQGLINARQYLNDSQVLLNH